LDAVQVFSQMAQLTDDILSIAGALTFSLLERADAAVSARLDGGRGSVGALAPSGRGFIWIQLNSVKHQGLGRREGLKA
jgi:hypothetical protein